MDWHRFLREERARKLAHIQVMASGNVTIIARSGGRTTDVSAEIIQENLGHVAEIETIFAAAGLPLDG